MTKRRAYFWATIIFICILALGWLIAVNTDIGKIVPMQTVQLGFYRVVEVYDGDTIAVDMNGQIEKVRMIGVDTPETHKPDTPVQCYGPEASEYTKNLLTNKTVRLEADPTNSNRDRYDRLLRYVYTEEGELVNQSLISLGYGFDYLSFTFQKSKEFAALGDAARNSRVGLWAACQSTFKDGRWQSNNL